MIIKLNIFNMEKFLEMLNKCSGAINLLSKDKKRENINKQYVLQNKLLKEHKKNKDFLELSLDITNLKDYINIVFFTIGDY